MFYLLKCLSLMALLPGHLHGQPDRVDERPAAEGHRQPRSVPARQAAGKVRYAVGVGASGWKQGSPRTTISFDGRLPTD